MRLIDADAVRDAIYGMHVNGKEGVENALRNTYGADLREVLYEIDELPTVCDIKQIKAEIAEEVSKHSDEWQYVAGLMTAKDIFEKHMRGESE